MTRLPVAFKDLRHLAVVALFFMPLYLLSRSPLLSGDGNVWVQAALLGLPSHFPQVSIVHWLWTRAQAVNVLIDVKTIHLAVSFLATLVAIFYAGKIAERLTARREARWIASFFFGTSISIWLSWNGELHALAFAFLLVAIYYALNHRFYLAAALALAFLFAGGWLTGGSLDFTTFTAPPVRRNFLIHDLVSASILFGLVWLLTKKRIKPPVLGVYLVGIFLLNLFGSVLSVRSYGLETLAFQKRLRASGKDLAIVSCNVDEALNRGPGYETLVVHDLFQSSDTKARILRWVSQRTAEGKTVYIFGHDCVADQASLDFGFLESVYEFHASEFRGLPLNWTVQTNPYNWRKADLYRLDPK